MNRNTAYNAIPGGWSLNSILRDLVAAWRLFWDPSVPSALKIFLPLMAIAYWLSPIDLLPGLPFDDVALMILALRLFVQLAPSDAVGRAFGGASRGENSRPADGGRVDQNQMREDDQRTVDTTWRVIDD